MYHPSFNIGIQEEYQLIDPKSRELLGYVSQPMGHGEEPVKVFERTADLDFAHISSDVVQVGTPVCADVQEAREKLLRLRNSLLELGEREGFRVIAAGTHPFSRWETRSEVVPRFRPLVEDTQLIARRLLAFGTHIHIGIENRELVVDVMNTMRYLMPHLLCLATSSPFWQGRNTGLKSYRSVLLDALPRTGVPGYFESYYEYRAYVDTLIRTNSIADASRIYLDIMPHYRYPTLVIRACDMLPDYRDTLAVTALAQAVAAWMVELRQHNMSFRIYERTLIEENKWRAVRYGLDGKLIDFGVEEELPARDLLDQLIERIQPQVERLHLHDNIEHVRAMMERGTSADQQVEAWSAAGEDPNAVVDMLIKQTQNTA